MNSNYPDKTFYTVATVEDGRYKVYLSTDMVSKAGTLKLQIALYKGSEELIQSEVKEVEVTESMANGGSIGKDLVVDFTKLEKALERVDAQEKAYKDSLQKQEAIRVDVTNKQKQVSTDTTAVKKIRTDMEGVMAAEASRVSAEKARQSQESIRLSRESTRIDQECARQSNEITRDSQEKQRVEAEKKRVSAETLRVSAESTRSSQENTRQNEESKRKSAESTRVSAENTRESQENARQSQETQRVEVEKKRKSTFESWDKTMQGVIPNATSSTAGVVKVIGTEKESAPYTVPSVDNLNITKETLSKSIENRAEKVHKHTIEDVTNLQNKLEDTASKEHRHKCTEIDIETQSSAAEHYFTMYLNDVIDLMVDDIHDNKSAIENTASKDHTHDSIKANLSGATKDLKFVITSKATYTGMTKGPSTLYFVQE